MRLIDASPHDPVENVALDATLFAAVEERNGEETLRFWESPDHVVVIGRFGVVRWEVDEPACRAHRVPIVRRSSGGGAVVVGPGCLNYSCVLSLDTRPELRDVARSYALILGPIARVLGLPGLHVSGISDLAVGDRKVGGSAQRRGRRALLHHGTMLYAFDSTIMARCLKRPRREPAYRAGRSHAAFVSNLPLAPAAITSACVEALAGPRARAGEPAQRS